MPLDTDQKKLVEELLFTDVKRPSFAKSLYFGKFDASTIIPYPQEADDPKINAFIEKIKLFSKNSIDPALIDRQANIPETLIKELGELGLLGITVPTKYNGLGMSQRTFCQVAEIIAMRCSSTALFINAHQSIGLRALLLFGTPEQRERWLPSMAKGQKIGAFSLTEPNAGSDASGIETRAVYDKEKNVYRINGKKQWTTNGSIADILTVMAKTEVETPQGPQDKITAFLVTPDMPGFIITEPALEKVGMRGTKTANLAFKDMEVPAANVLGPIGGGLKVCLTVLDYGRTTFGATCTGAAKLLEARAIEHARTRYQFKRPLASFPLVKQKIAMISALTYAMNATTYLTAGLVDAGVEDFMLEAAMLKVFASDSLWAILYDTMQIFGGRSFFTDEPFERMMRDARLNMIGEGSNEVMRAFIGAVGMRDVGMQLKKVQEALYCPWTGYKTLLQFTKESSRKWKSPSIPIHSLILQPEAARLSKAVRAFGWAVTRALMKYREGVVEEQFVLNRIATSAIAIYTTTAVLSKLDADLIRVHGNIQALGNDVSVGKFYCNYAMDTLQSNLHSLFTEKDEAIAQLSDKLTR